MSPSKKRDTAFQKCINPDCGAEFECALVTRGFKCPRCGELLDVCYEWDKVAVPRRLCDFGRRWASRDNPLDFSGVWRFRELLDFCEDRYKVTIGEGQTILQRNDAVAKYVGMRRGSVFLQYEGLNPSGSFKDNGMAAAFSHAKMVGARSSACASTGNTSASVAMYAHSCEIKCTVLIGSGRIAFGKLSQAMDYGARTIQIDGDFDECMRRVQEVCGKLGLYLLNSLNPFRLEGQKTTIFRIIEQMGWTVPEWVVVPGGNLGNSSAFAKAFYELKQLGLIDQIAQRAGEQQEAHVERGQGGPGDYRRVLLGADGPRFFAAHVCLGDRNIQLGADGPRFFAAHLCLGDRNIQAGQSEKVSAGDRGLQRRSAGGDG